METLLNVLFSPSPIPKLASFCGVTVFGEASLLHLTLTKASDEGLRARCIYMTDTFNVPILAKISEAGHKVFIVTDLCPLPLAPIFRECAVTLIDSDAVPLNVHGAGIFFPRFFTSPPLFRNVESCHEFQTLTDSNKDSKAMRKGLYMSHVEPLGGGVGGDGGECKRDVEHAPSTLPLTFHLLRCSTNFEGPTEGFAPVDEKILWSVNEVAGHYFRHGHQEEEGLDNGNGEVGACPAKGTAAKLNHVLAQIYYNSTASESVTGKETKAKISKHSDKTKDMPNNGLIAFATFYDVPVAAKDASLLTQLEFALKNPATHPERRPKFRVTLSPNSLFIISLETNRLYTHEIKPSSMPVARLPTRMGYVIRSSKTKALHRGGKTYVDGQVLRFANEEETKDIKALYLRENLTDEKVDYGDATVTLNRGDQMRPILNKK